METIEDILREMQETSRLYLSGGNDSSSVFEMLSTYHDRIESAYKGLPGMWVLPTENAELRAENARLKAALYSDADYGRILKESDDEIKRLKAALKPVLEVEWPTGISGGIDTQLLEPLTCICDAVRSAQLIYHGGAK